MAQENWSGENSNNSTEGKARESVKTVRFLNTKSNETCDKKCKTLGNGEADSSGNSTISMVQNLVPHLPGLDKDKIYVISGPFPNFDPLSGPSQLLMATPVAPGATIIAVPTGSPPNNVKQVAAAAQNGPPGAVFHPVQPHMLHWDCHHPGGRVVPLRQPVPPVYYNLPPSHNSSGLQSPNSSEGSGSISESSSTSGDQEGDNLASQQLYLKHGLRYQPMPPVMAQPSRHIQGYAPPAPYHQLGPVSISHHFPLYDQVYISL